MKELRPASYPSVLIPQRGKSTDQPAFSMCQSDIRNMDLVNSKDQPKLAVQCRQRHKP